MNIEISETGFSEYLKAIIGGENDEHVRIYSGDKLYYEDKSEVWNKIYYFYEDINLEVKIKLIDFEYIEY